MFVCVTRKGFVLYEIKIMAENKKSKELLFTYSKRGIMSFTNYEILEIIHKNVIQKDINF